MILKIRNGIIYVSEEGIDRAIGTILDGVEELPEKTIECGSEIIPAVQNFIKEVNSGSFKPRKIVKELEDILHKYAI